ncbi:hypothetical protein BJ994_000210 [Arthrobacter pigmenti]|uniref:Uncharacterized protein n=1 Tax=Arthrobacter pigmenti TaxID=271432 RepID=A0A846RLH5_9MICC|nr:hypothetical protein [Arthrobacter pigmenti]NJC21134.1 hypothetical protein [Arthrobacter pigmenti]
MEPHSSRIKTDRFFGAPALLVIGLPVCAVMLLIATKLLGIPAFPVVLGALLALLAAGSVRSLRVRGGNATVRQVLAPAVVGLALFLGIGWNGLTVSGAGPAWSDGSLPVALIAGTGGFTLFRLGGSGAK